MSQQSDSPDMQYRALGKTGLRVSVIGFGASPLGNVFRTTVPEEGKRAVHMAIDSGINFFDVSPYYGLTLAETRLGEALAGYRDKVILATKCGRYGTDEFDFSAARVTAGIEDSLRRLKTDHVDLLQVHDLEFGDVQQVIDETIPALRKLQEQGKTRYIGITGYPLKALIRVAQAAPVDTILSYCRYNLMITDMDDGLTPFAQKQGIGLINASGLHMGILTERGAPDWHPAPQSIRDAGQKAAAFCKLHGTDISTVGLRFCLDYPYVATTLIGMSTPHHVESNLNLLRLTTDPNLVQELTAIFAPVFNLVWPSGRPENQD